MKNLMKAKAGMLLIAILMIAFTGFGATTADPVQNSTDQITVDFHADMVNVVAADAVQIQTLVIAESNAATQSISVNDVALKTLEPEMQLQTTYTLEADYFPDGNSWCSNSYNYLGNKEIFYLATSNRIRAQDYTPATS